MILPVIPGNILLQKKPQYSGSEREYIEQAESARTVPCTGPGIRFADLPICRFVNIRTAGKVGTIPNHRRHLQGITEKL